MGDIPEFEHLERGYAAIWRELDARADRKGLVQKELSYRDHWRLAYALYISRNTEQFLSILEEVFFEKPALTQ